MEYNSNIIKDILTTLGMSLPATRVVKLEESILGRELPIDTIKELVVREFNSVGPQGVSCTVRLSEEEYKNYQLLMEQVKIGVERSPKKQLFKQGLQLTLLDNYEVQRVPVSPLKVTVNFDVEMMYLIRKVISKYSTELGEITGAAALRLGLNACSEKYL